MVDLNKTFNDYSEFLNEIYSDPDSIYRCDKKSAIEAMENYIATEGERNGGFLGNLCDKLKSDIEVVLLACETGSTEILDADKKLLLDEDFIVSLSQVDKYILDYLKEKLSNETDKNLYFNELSNNEVKKVLEYLKIYE